MRMPRMNDRPAASISFWLASEIMPASATIVTSGSWWAVMNAAMTGTRRASHRRAKMTGGAARQTSHGRT